MKFSKSVITLTLITLFCVYKVNTLNILGIFPYEGKSHFFVFQPYLLELAKRGHNLTIISYFPQKTAPDNYHDINLGGKSPIKENVFSLDRSNYYWDVIKIVLFVIEAGTVNCQVMLADDNVQDLWKSNAKFDLAIVEEFNSDCGKGLAHKLGLPIIGITSHAPMPYYYRKQGILYNPSSDPFMFLEGGSKPTLYQRIERMVVLGFVNMAFKYFGQRVDQNTLAQYFDDVPPLEEISRQTLLTLVYQNFALKGSSLNPSNLIEVGGYHVAEPKPLPDNLRKFIEESKHGVIYISFGSMLRAASTSAETIQTIIDTVSPLPQRVIWKWEESELPGNPENIYVSNWVPQNDILAHPNVLAFYSHGGLLSTTEAIHHGVPVVVMPIFGDQPLNAGAIEESGLGVQIKIRDLSVEKLSTCFNTVLDPQFRKNVKELSRLWHDRPMTAMDTAIFWTEFAARNPKMNFRAKTADTPYYQLLCLDIIFLCLIFIFAVLSVIKVLFSLLWSKKPQVVKNRAKKGLKSH